MNKKIVGSILGILLLIGSVVFMLNLSDKETVNQDKFAGDPIEEVDMDELIVEEEKETDMIKLNEDNEIVNTENESINEVKNEISNTVKDLNGEKENLKENINEVETPLYQFEKKTKGKDTVTKKKVYEPLTIYFKDKSVSYKNAGVSGAVNVIDNSDSASTWGGAEVFSGTDNQNTHFIGHYNKQFSNINGTDKFIVTDSNGTPFTYITTAIYEVDEYGIGIEDGIDYWERIASPTGGERIVIQTSTGKQKEKLIIEASIK